LCCKLFTQVGPDVAVFGEKDYQQLCVIRQMVRDLDLPLQIVGAPTVRDADGLALSSRNAYLMTEQRHVAPLMHRVLTQVAAAASDGRDVEKVLANARADLRAAGFDPIDYVEVREAETLAPVAPGSRRPLRALAAAWLGKTRLIDNVAVATGHLINWSSRSAQSTQSRPRPEPVEGPPLAPSVLRQAQHGVAELGLFARRGRELQDQQV
jgi:pantoate--beta-alanine ligase